MKNLVIVESPAKAKTIKKYLGPGFEVLASYGHVRDLLPKEGAVDPTHHFKMHYELIEKNEKHVAAIVKAMNKSDALFLATDPDREGEAISWHVYQILKERELLTNKPVQRIVFHEITKGAVQAALENPRDISMDLVNAQQARRALDFLVGFNLSPLLWRKIRRGLSAGRVQSPALRMIVEREEEIEKFVSQEYWDITSDLFKSNAFSAKLQIYQEKKVEQFTFTNEKETEAAKKALLKAANGKLIVTKVDKKQRKRNPAAPFITSTLQQEAARKLGFTAQRTMRTAQQLYEGIDIGQGAVGLISYMRTDSVNLAVDAVTEIRELIAERYGKENVPDQVPVYKTKARNAQEAHEAIRPTSSHVIPDSISEFLSAEQFKLYDLIWKRTVASQMVHATIDTVAVDLACGDKHSFRANGHVITKPGFMHVYQEGHDDKKAADTDEERILPPLEKGDEVELKDVATHQHFTEPPPRYSEATLIKALEEFGIGRPSTYASIIYTLQHREYVNLENKRFHPTDVGRIVNKFLTKYFTRYVDYGFTAQLEDELDEISRGEKEWIPLLEGFWDPFNTLVHEILETVQRKDVTQEALDENCPTCGKPLSIRLGKHSRFIGCTGYPECKYTRSLDEDKNTAVQPEAVEGRLCPKCNSPLQIKVGRYGKFIGCSNYPNCKHLESLVKPADTGVDCPECHEGHMLKRRSRNGKIFYSCSRYPDCKYALWYEPVNKACSKCAWPLMMIKVTKKRGSELVCPHKPCDNIEPYDAPPAEPT